MTRPTWLSLLLVVLSACFESHGTNTQALGNEDCYTCHKPEYDATGPKAAFPQSPVHATGKCSTQCATCHTTDTWANYYGACEHPEQAFPIVAGDQGNKHSGIKCKDCHSDAISVALNVTAKAGANTDCTSCHPNTSAQAQDHVGVTYDAGTFVGQPYSYKDADHRFCLDCHPKGLAIGHGPSNPFILPHGGSTCAQCHDSASGLGHQGGADVRCSTSGCHTRIDADGSEHSNPDTGHHPQCLQCHWDGRKHDGG